MGRRGEGLVVVMMMVVGGWLKGGDECRGK